MDIERSSTFTILEGGRSLLTPSYFLLRWTYITTDTPTYCICTNIGNDDGPILLQVTETGAVTPDPFSGEVQLGSGDHQLAVWEQTSSTNLFPPDTDPEFSELVRVANSAIPPPDPVDPCLGCAEQTACEVIADADPIEGVACFDDNDFTLWLAAVIADPRATPDLGVEAIANAGLTTEYQDLLCTGGDCPYTINVTVNGIAQAPITNVDPCVDNTLTITIN